MFFEKTILPRTPTFKNFQMILEIFDEVFFTMQRLCKSNTLKGKSYGTKGKLWLMA